MLMSETTSVSPRSAKKKRVTSPLTIPFSLLFAAVVLEGMLAVVPLPPFLLLS